MRLLVSAILILLLPGTFVYAQSKKELRAEIDTLKAKIAEMEKPIEVNLDNPHVKASYGMGVLVASNIRSQGSDSLNVEALVAGLTDVFEDKTPKMTPQECSEVVQTYMQKIMEEKTAALRADGDAFLEANKSKEGVTTTASGLQYKVLASGSGKTPGASSSVKVHYTGKLIDGTVFDSSVERGEPIDLKVNGVISGWTEALQLMKEGDKWELYIPYQLGYGERGAGGSIPPFATLIFEVELLKVNN